MAQAVAAGAAALAAAYTGGTTRVSFDGRTVEYRSLDELGRALAVLGAPPALTGTVAAKSSTPGQAARGASGRRGPNIRRRARRAPGG